MSDQPTSPPASGNPPVIIAREVTKTYGVTKALTGVDLEVRPGEVVGVVGHNGAGKSTLMRVLSGIEAISSGTVTAGGTDQPDRDGFAGIRMAYQETSLCPDLTVAENVYLSARAWMPAGSWLHSASAHVSRRLDEVFPGHGVSPDHYIEDLSMGQRQIVEIVRATIDDDLKVLILDEPTESLTSDASTHLYEYVRGLAATGVAVLLISHRMAEVLSVATRVVVLKDGAIAGDDPVDAVTEQSLLERMGAEVAVVTTAEQQRRVPPSADAPVVATVKARAAATGDPYDIVARKGEVVGLAGIAGQGQEEILADMWRPSRADGANTSSRAFVPGDRQRNGIFPLWSVADNLSITAMRSLARTGRRRLAEERSTITQWVDRLHIRGGAGAMMTALSGGNQQKVIVARAFASDAELILLDDPFRGVDVHTKTDLYQLIRSEASSGRTVVWFSSENAEMSHCDRVYVLRAGRVAAELHGDEINEDRIISESFAVIGGNE
jgi:ribose transport system ATP-binding protein